MIFYLSYCKFRIDHKFIIFYGCMEARQTYDEYALSCLPAIQTNREIV